MIILMAFYFPELQTKTKSFWFFSFHWHLYNKSPIRIRYKKKRSIQLYVEPKRGLTSNGFYWIRKKLSAFQFTRVIRSTSSQRPVDSGEFDWNKLKKNNNYSSLRLIFWKYAEFWMIFFSLGFCKLYLTCEN